MHKEHIQAYEQVISTTIPYTNEEDDIQAYNTHNCIKPVSVLYIHPKTHVKP